LLQPTAKQILATNLAVPGHKIGNYLKSLAGVKSLGKAISGSNSGDLDGVFTTYATNATANTADTVAHALGRAPVGYMLVNSQKGGRPFHGGTVVAGYETGAASPSTDISGGSATTFKIAVDSDTVTPTYQSVTLTLTGLNTGAGIAAAMQTAVRALSGIYVAVTVTFTNSVYVITSGTTGSASKVRIAAGATNDVAAALKIGAVNGAVDTDGTTAVISSTSTTISLKCTVASDTLTLLLF